jgi:hypothetical protein
MFCDGTGRFKADSVHRCASNQNYYSKVCETNIHLPFLRHIPFLPLISWENAVATSSAVVLNENTGEVVDINTISGEVNFEDRNTPRRQTCPKFEGFPLWKSN